MRLWALYLILVCTSLSPSLFAKSRSHKSLFYRSWLYPRQDLAEAKIKSLSEAKKSSHLKILQIHINPWVLVTRSFVSQQSAANYSKSTKSPSYVLYFRKRYWICYGEFYDWSVLRAYQKVLDEAGVAGARIKQLGKRRTTAYQVIQVDKQYVPDFINRWQKRLGYAHFNGFYQNSAAYAVEKPGHWSKFKNWFEGSLDSSDETFRWKLSGRYFYDLAYNLESDYFSSQVAENQKSQFFLGETYFDFDLIGWNFRIGRQDIVWGDLKGAWVADVVSARDLRDFILPRPELINIPQWALSAEKTWSKSHLQLIAMPFATVDEFGVFGSDFFPLVTSDYAGYSVYDLGREAPNSSNSFGFGFEYDHHNSQSNKLSVFYLNAVNREGRYERSVSAKKIYLRAKHFPVQKAGLTYSHNFENSFLHLELAFTPNDKIATKDLTDADGLVDQQVVDFAASLDMNLYDAGQTTIQYVDRTYLNYNNDLLVDQNEHFVTLFSNYLFEEQDMSAEVSAYIGVQRLDVLLRPRFKWLINSTLSLSAGYDMFNGNENGLFGRYANNDRFYSELRWSY